MNKKLLLIPTIALSATLLLSACTSGNGGGIDKENPPASSSSSSASPSSTTEPTQEPVVIDGYVAPPEDMEDKYAMYFFAPTSFDEALWSSYKTFGAKTYSEDSAPRSTTVNDWESVRGDENKIDSFSKIYGEVMSDVEQSALNVSEYLKENESASFDEIKANSDLLVNRYGQLGTMSLEQDPSTGFYFVLFYQLDSETSIYGILVTQEGVTPEFSAIAPE